MKQIKVIILVLQRPKMRQRMPYNCRSEDGPPRREKVCVTVFSPFCFGFSPYNWYGHQPVCCSADKYNLKNCIAKNDTNCLDGSSNQISCGQYPKYKEERVVILWITAWNSEKQWSDMFAVCMMGFLLRVLFARISSPAWHVTRFPTGMYTQHEQILLG